MAKHKTRFSFTLRYRLHHTYDKQARVVIFKLDTMGGDCDLAIFEIGLYIPVVKSTAGKGGEGCLSGDKFIAAFVHPTIH